MSVTRILAVDYSAGKALFEVNDEQSAIVDINKNDVDGVMPTHEALTASAWLKVSPDFEYPSTWRELADASTTSLEIEETPVQPRERKFRIPKTVKEEASQGLTWVQGFERGNTALGLKIAKMLASETYITASKVERIARYFSRRPESIKENAGFQDGTQGFPSDERIRYSLWGGDPAREWATGVAKKHGLIAAGGYGATPETVSDDVDGSKPHAFVPDVDSPNECAICGRSVDDEIHVVVAGAFEYEHSCEYFGRGVDPDETLVTELYKLSEDLEWSRRVASGWETMDDPHEDEILIMLDPESAYALADILDDVAPHDPEILPFELASLNPHEAALAAAAYAEIDWDFVDRVFDIYDSQERSINAQKQTRGPGGRFGEQPDAPAEDKQQEEQPQVKKAQLPQPMDLVPNVGARIDEYLQQVAAERAQRSGGDSGAQPAQDEYSALVRLGEFAEQPPAAAAPAQEIAPSQETDQGAVSDVRPMYLAIVDEIDTEAVLDVIALVPPEAGQQGDVTVWKRNAGAWEPAPELLTELRGTTPPPVVELSDNTVLGQVLEQVDQATSENDSETTDQQEQPANDAKPAAAPGQTEVSPDGSSGTKPDANPDQQRRAASAIEFGDYSEDQRKRLAKRGMALPDGSFPIENVSDLKNAIQAFGRAKNQDLAQAHIIKRAKALGRTDLLPDDWDKNSTESYSLWGPNGEIMSLIAVGGKEVSPKDVKNTERLRRYWTTGEGGLKIGWNTPGDWYRCVSHLSKYLGPRAKGYCTLRHKEATGFWPGQQENLGKDK